MRKLLLSAVAVAALFNAPAIAADIPVKGPVYKAVPYYNWTGWYGGINGGYGQDPTYWFQAPPDAPILMRLEPSGAFGGLQIGYNWHFRPNWLFGIETDFQFADINDRFNFTYPGGGASYAVLAIDYFATIRGRFGYVMDRNLFYFTAGGALAKFQANIFGDIDGGNDALINNDQWLGGYVVGLGYERAFNGNWRFKVEYLYIDFAHLDIRGFQTFGGTAMLTGDPYLHIFRLGLNMRFSSGG